jgi:hypothetical protein
MKKVDRSELLSFAAYEEIRPHFRGRMIQAKTRRRMNVGDHMSLVFENHDTMLLQVQECATLFIEYDDVAQRARMLQRLASLRSAMQLVIGEAKFGARFATHHGEEMDRLPAVNYLTFEPGAARAAQLRDGSVPASIAVAHPDYEVHVPLPKELREELARDLE